MAGSARLLIELRMAGSPHFSASPQRFGSKNRPCLALRQNVARRLPRGRPPRVRPIRRPAGDSELSAPHPKQLFTIGLTKWPGLTLLKRPMGLGACRKLGLGPRMYQVLTCLTTEHDLRLVVLAGAVCFLASTVA